MAKYLDYDGLKIVWARIKTVDSNGNVTSGLAYDLMNYADNAANNAIANFQTNFVGNAKIVTVGTITTGTWHGKAIEDAYIASAGKWNGKQDALTFDSRPKSGSSNPVTSAGIYSAIEEVKSLAEGKTSAYAIETESVTGYENGTFNVAKTSSTKELKITKVTNQIVKSMIIDLSGKSVELDSLDVGDIIYTTTKNIKDWWYAGLKTEKDSSGKVTSFYYDFLELDADSPDLSGYVTNSDFNALKNTLGTASTMNYSDGEDLEDGALPTGRAVKGFIDGYIRPIEDNIDHAINGIEPGASNGETTFTTIGGDSTTKVIVKGLNNAAYYDVAKTAKDIETGGNNKLPAIGAVADYVTNSIDAIPSEELQTEEIETEELVISSVVVSQSEPDGTNNPVSGKAVKDYCSARYVLTSNLSSISEAEINAICI